MTAPSKPNPADLACPVPIQSHATIQLAHGGGGRLSERLIAEVFLPAFRNPALAALHDGALIDLGGQRLAFSTDSYVVRPLFFPGGDIGSLAVHGTVNDLAMCGARPLALSAGFILEEGFPMHDLGRIVESMRAAAAEAEVSIVTGDTKVVDRGKGDGVYLNTAGIGLVPAEIEIDPRRAAPGDMVLVSGTLADHGIAILSVREGLEFETALESDSAPLGGLVAAILEAGGRDVHVLRDPTRGGVASTLNEIASAARVGVRLEEMALPVREAVRGACELLGFDPLYVANEGKCLAVVAPGVADRVLEAMRAHRYGRDAAVIGQIVAEPPGRVVLRSSVGSLRIVDLLTGEQLPRIC
ncbi:MAG: hydrogenase expression/formation protein HypE [Polyangiaceae bacterium]|nr:hydrogenase expression/formation protein HypE [Polyangiaceae bacterium]